MDVPVIDKFEAYLKENMSEENVSNILDSVVRVTITPFPIEEYVKKTKELCLCKNFNNEIIISGCKHMTCHSCLVTNNLLNKQLLCPVCSCIVKRIVAIV